MKLRKQLGLITLVTAMMINGSVYAKTITDYNQNANPALLSGKIVLCTQGNKAFVNGNEVEGEWPQIMDNTTVVPLRFISENFDAKVEWQQADNLITITSEDRIVRFKIGEKQMTINGEVVELSVPSMGISGVTYVPLRTISVALNKSVDYNPTYKLIFVGGSINDKVTLETLQKALTGSIEDQRRYIAH